MLDLGLRCSVHYRRCPRHMSSRQLEGDPNWGLRRYLTCSVRTSLYARYPEKIPMKRVMAYLIFIVLNISLL